jgi:hypothetical protein
MAENVLFNDGWEFCWGDFSWADLDAGAPAWRPVALPHDWSIAGPFDPNWASATGFQPGVPEKNAGHALWLARGRDEAGNHYENA